MDKLPFLASDKLYHMDVMVVFLSVLQLYTNYVLGIKTLFGDTWLFPFIFVSLGTEKDFDLI